MTVKRLHIVALPYYEVGECLDEFLAQAPGLAMTLRPEPKNRVDANAICAYDWQGRKAGYVAVHDQQEAWQMLRGSGRRSLRGRITEVNAAHKCVVFECHVETMGEVEELFPESTLLEWSYSGPEMAPTQELMTLEYMMDEIGERLDEHESWDETEREAFVMLTQKFCTLSKYDLSGEMCDYRRRLCLRLLATKDSALQPLADELKMTYGRAGRESLGGDVLDYWQGVFADPEMMSSLLVHRKEYDVERIRLELEQFPEAMYLVWQEDRRHFAAKLLYLHVPRKVLWRLISGIAFCEAVEKRDKVYKAIAGKNICIEDMRGFLDEIIEIALTLTNDEIKGLLLTLGNLNMKYEHAFDEQLFKMYDKLGIPRSEIQNIFKSGSNCQVFNGLTSGEFGKQLQ